MYCYYYMYYVAKLCIFRSPESFRRLIAITSSLSCVIHRHYGIHLLSGYEGSSHCVSPWVRTVAREHRSMTSISYQGTDTITIALIPIILNDD